LTPSGGPPWELEIAGLAPADMEADVEVEVTGPPGVEVGVLTRSRHRKVACIAPFLWVRAGRGTSPSPIRRSGASGRGDIG
jgi:hypothetical protein